MNAFIPKQDIAKSFSDAASGYDAAAILQHEVAERVFERLDLIRVAPKQVLDIGCGTGVHTRRLKQQFSRAKVYGIDIAPGMIAVAKAQEKLFGGIKYQVADADQLPFKDNSMDLIFSNLTLQWLPDLAVTFKEWNRVLKPGGLIIFSTLGPDTLYELRESWQQVDDYVHVNPFLDMHLVGDAVFHNGFENVVMDRDVITMTYKTLKGLMGDLKSIGAHNMNPGRPRGMMSRARWQKLQQAYEAFRWQDGQLPATYEVVFGHAWKKQDAQSGDYHTYAVKMQSPSENRG